MTVAHNANSYDVICIGAGPTGLACAIEAKRANLRPLVIDKGCLCNSLYHYPTNMNFFTTPERMEIGDLPMTTSGGKPTRAEALKYYRRAAEHYGIEVAQYQLVERISGHDGAFTVSACDVTMSDYNAPRHVTAPDSKNDPPKGVSARDVTMSDYNAPRHVTAPDSKNDPRKGVSARAVTMSDYNVPRHVTAPDSKNDPRKGTVLTVPNDVGTSGVLTPEAGPLREYRARKLILATGYYDLPNFLSVPGEDLPHVSHYFTDAHPYWDKDVVVIGAKNSAAEAALDLFRGGARVTLIHRGAELGRSLKFWVRPDLENRIKAGEIAARFNTKVVRFEPGKVVVQNGHASGHDAARTESLPAFHAFAMTGYHPDFQFLESAGIELDPKTRKPRVNLETLETNVPGIYVAGVLVGGLHTGEIFIENGRFHGRQIIAAIAGREGPREPAPVAPPGE